MRHERRRARSQGTSLKALRLQRNLVIVNPGDRPLDVYSQIVSGVAERLTPKVASLRVPRHGGAGESLGSGVVFTRDGFLLTNAQVVGQADSGTAAFQDGTEARFTVVGADPLSDLAVLHATAPVPEPAELGEADDLGLAMLPGPVPAAWRKRLDRTTGLLVSQAVPGSPADRAGLRPGDLLLTAGGKPVKTAQDLQRLMFADAIGHPFPITVMRNGALVDVIAEPTELVAA
jgi:S1-C subfamily serine protease